MRKFSTISASLFLCMYCLILLHNVVPHVHCDDLLEESSVVVKSHSDVHDHHHHGGHHHHEEAESHGLSEFILDFLGGMDHQETEEGELSWYIGDEVSLQIAAFDLLPLPAVVTEPLSMVSVLESEPEKCNGPPPLLQQRRSSNTTTLRGPPSLA